MKTSLIGINQLINSDFIFYVFTYKAVEAYYMNEVNE